jgi:anti-anti-sigma factor
MLNYRYLDVVDRGPVSRVSILNHKPFAADEIAELTKEWNSVADESDCQALFVDFSNVKVLSSEMLSKLILLQRRLKKRGAKLVLSGLRPEVREVLGWTKLDRFFEIIEDVPAEAVRA